MIREHFVQEDDGGGVAAECVAGEGVEDLEIQMACVGGEHIHAWNRKGFVAVGDKAGHVIQ